MREAHGLRCDKNPHGVGLFDAFWGSSALHPMGEAVLSAPPPENADIMRVLGGILERAGHAFRVNNRRLDRQRERSIFDEAKNRK